MKNSVNSVRLIGNVGVNPEVRNLDGGKKVANLRLATTERFKNKEGEWVESTDWHTLVFWGKQAETVEKYVTKGEKLAIEGKITHRDYTGKDGQKRFITEIWVNELLMMNSKKKETKQEEVNEDLPF